MLGEGQPGTVDAIRGREMQFALARSLANIEVDQSANAWDIQMNRFR